MACDMPEGESRASACCRYILVDQLRQLLNIKVCRMSREFFLMLIRIQLTDNGLQEPSNEMTIQLFVKTLIRVSPKAIVTTGSSLAQKLGFTDLADVINDQTRRVKEFFGVVDKGSAGLSFEGSIGLDAKGRADALKAE